MDDRQYGCEQYIYNNLANILTLYRFVLELYGNPTGGSRL